MPVQALFGQVLIGLINGAFYAMLSLGLSVIFGLLNIINFAHGALYMTGAFAAYFLLQWAGLGYWWSLLLAPIAVGLLGVVLEKTMLKRLYHLDHLYGLLLTFGIALIIQGGFRNEFGSSGLPYAIPSQLTGGYNLGFMFLPTYRAWVVVFSIVVCVGTWLVIERTRLGACLRATGGALRPNRMTATVKDYVVAPPVSVAAAWPRHQMLAFAVMVGLLVIAPFVAYPVFLMKALCFALFACAFNLLIGYVGLLSFGHAMFLGAAGYGSAHAAKVWGWPPEAAIVMGTAVAAALGLVIGALAIRRQGIYFAMITLALSQVVFF